MQESFVLKWNFHNANIPSTLGRTLENLDSSDVTLVCDELVAFKAHKFVIGASSSILKEILLSNDHDHPTIYLKGIQQQELHRGD